MPFCVCNIVGLSNGKANVEHEITRENHRRYAERVGAEYRVEFVDIGENVKCCWWKWKASDIAAEYDSTLLLDCDCVVTKKCPSFQYAVPAGHWGGVDEIPRMRKSLMRYVASCADVNPEELSLCINGGVLLMPRDAKIVYYADYESMPVNWQSDQMLLSKKLAEGMAPYRRLDRRWNWSYVSHVDFVSGRDQAFILHHAGRNGLESPEKRNRALLRDVQELGI